MKLRGKKKAAFLARMARGRRKKHRVKHRGNRTHIGGKTVARTRRHRRKHTSHRRRRHHSAGMSRWLPPQDTLIGIGTAFAYGKVEAAASKDPKHFLTQVPALVPALGRAGNAGALLWLGGVVTKHHIVKSIASGVLHVAAYQHARQNGAFEKNAQEFKMGAPSNNRRDEVLVEDYLQRQRG